MFRPWMLHLALLAVACVIAPSVAGETGRKPAVPRGPRRVASTVARPAPPPLRVRPTYDGTFCKPPTILPILGPSELAAADSFELVMGVLVNHMRSWIQYFQDGGDPLLRERNVCAGFLGEPTLPVGFLLDGARYVFLGSDTLMHAIAVSDVEIDSWPLTVVLAHEFGHYLQDLHRFRFSAASAHRRESHADCVGGYLSGVALGFLAPDDPNWTDRMESNPAFWLHEERAEGSIERRVSFQEGLALASISLVGGEPGLTSGEVLSSCYHRQTPFRIERKLEAP